MGEQKKEPCMYINNKIELNKNNNVKTKNIKKRKLLKNDETNILKYDKLYSYLNKNEKKSLLQECLLKNTTSNKSYAIQIFSEKLKKYDLDLELNNSKLYISIKFIECVDVISKFLKNEFYFKKKKNENVILLLAKKYEISEILLRSIYLKEKIHDFFKNDNKIDECFIKNNFKKNYESYKNVVTQNFFLFKNNFSNNIKNKKDKTYDKNNSKYNTRNLNYQVTNETNNINDIGDNLLNNQNNKSASNRQKLYTENNLDNSKFNVLQKKYKKNIKNNEKKREKVTQSREKKTTVKKKKIIKNKNNYKLKKGKDDLEKRKLLKKKEKNTEKINNENYDVSDEKYVNKEDLTCKTNLIDKKKAEKNNLSNAILIDGENNKIKSINDYSIEEKEQKHNEKERKLREKEEKMKKKEQTKKEKEKKIREKEEKKKSKEEIIMKKNELLRYEKEKRKKIKEKKIREKEEKKKERERAKKEKEELIRNEKEKKKIIREEKKRQKEEFLRKMKEEKKKVKEEKKKLKEEILKGIKEERKKFKEIKSEYKKISRKDHDLSKRKIDKLKKEKEIKINKNQSKTYIDKNKKKKEIILIGRKKNSFNKDITFCDNKKNKKNVVPSVSSFTHENLSIDKDSYNIIKNNEMSTDINERENVNKNINILYENNSENTKDVGGKKKEVHKYSRKNKVRGREHLHEINKKSADNDIYEELNKKNTYKMKRKEYSISIETTNNLLIKRKKVKKDDIETSEINNLLNCCEKKKSIIEIPNNVIDKKRAKKIVSYKHELKDKKKKKKKISLFGNVKPVDIIKRGIDAYQILENEENLYTDVLIIGAGVSGLAASYYLNKCGAKILVIEGRNRIGGRAFSTVLPERIINNKILPETVVDLGANYLHCCDNSDLSNENKTEKTENMNNIKTLEEILEEDIFSGGELKLKEKKGKKKKRVKKKKYNNNNNNHYDVNELEKILSNNLKLFREEYLKLFKDFQNSPIWTKINNNDNEKVPFFKRTNKSYSDCDYYFAKNVKDMKRKRLKKNMLFMIRNNIDNICHYYEKYYEKEKKNVLNFFKALDENIYFYNSLSDSSMNNSSSFIMDCVSQNKNKKFKILFVNKDPRKRREFDKSVTQLAEKLKPKVSLVCGKDNWESTFYAYWYNNEDGKKIKSFKIYRANLLCDKIRVRAARKIRNFLYINDIIYDSDENLGKDIIKGEETKYLINDLIDDNSIQLNKSNESCIQYSVNKYEENNKLVEYGTNNENNKNYEKKTSNENNLSDANSTKDMNNLDNIYNSNDNYTDNKNEKNVTLHLDKGSDDKKKICNIIKTENGYERIDNISKRRKSSPNNHNPRNFKLKKKTKNDLNISNYNDSVVIYDNYYNYGEDYCKIVKATSEKYEKKNVYITELYNDNKKRRSMWDLLMECTEEIFNEMGINQNNFTIEEWKMLMVMLQSRYGYGSDLRETSIAMSRIPFSTHMDIDICSNYGSNNYILKNLKYYDKIKKNEQIPHIGYFKDNSSADKIVVDGWKWLINYLSEDIQNKIFLNTVAELVQIKNEDEQDSEDKYIYYYNKEYKKSHLDNMTHKSNNFDNNNYEENDSNKNYNLIENALNNINYHKKKNFNKDTQKDYNFDKNIQKKNSLDTYIRKESSFDSNIQNEINIDNSFQKSNDSYKSCKNDDDTKEAQNYKSNYKPCDNVDNYNVFIRCKSYNNASKSINKSFHGIYDLKNIDYLNINIYAKYVIVALPLGSLINNDKKKSRKTCLKFDPELHPLKIKALNHYKMGNHNKIILRFYPYSFTWPFDSLQLNCLDQKFQFLNLHAYGKVGCVLVHCFPPWSSTYGYIKKEYFIVNECLYTLNKMFEKSGKKLPILVDYIVTKWQDDNFSFGSYAYPHVNCNDNDLIYLRSPHPISKPKVVFCGEYLSKSYFQCVDGAYDTGIRAAEDIAHIGLKLKSLDKKYYNTDVFFFPNNACPFTNIPLPKIQNSLLGFYLTDGSDEAITDYESTTDEECLSNIPISVMKKEYNFLAHSLNKIQNFFYYLKKDNFCKNSQEHKREKEKNKNKNKICYMHDNLSNKPLISYKETVINDVNNNYYNNYSNKCEYEKNVDISIHANELHSASNEKTNYKSDLILSKVYSADSENITINVRSKILFTHENTNADAIFKDINNDLCFYENKNDINSDENNTKKYKAIDNAYNDRKYFLDTFDDNLNENKKNDKSIFFFRKFNNNLDLYVDKYIIKIKDAIFYNYNTIELYLVNNEKNLNLVKSKFLLCDSLSAIIRKYYHFLFFILRELLISAEESKHFLFNDLINFTNIDFLSFFSEKKNDRLSKEEKKNLLNGIPINSENIDVIKEHIDVNSLSEAVNKIDNTNNLEIHFTFNKNVICNIKNNGTQNGYVNSNDIKENNSEINNKCENNKDNYNNEENGKLINGKKNEKNTITNGEERENSEIAMHYKKKYLYIQSKKIIYLNNYLKYVLNHISVTKIISEEKTVNINNCNKIKLSTSGFLFFISYILQHIMKQLNYDLYHSLIDENIIIQLLCDYIYYLIFYKHDVLCYKCMNGGELIMCDFACCTNGWHSYCLFSNSICKEVKLKKFWFCPNCSNSSKHVQRGCYNQDEIMKNYWKRRVYIYKIKFFLSRTRKIRKRLDLLKMELSKRIP
ncbi:lysine-specific histone demethylase 1, putative [Plasmodium relictum]|uniref:Lysine-specific histone demethylase 1, putative n=1 Tax=Plasmodium relictum TaxID=85471 RepID=A0A1J1HHK7_PLARL|nr:lysine-specific histone demethylase 1, putative [Plasmodium relictum]CRH03764.1 lysine-specific histone demethylase 1, putative [Plasmodium relictum]